VFPACFFPGPCYSDGARDCADRLGGTRGLSRWLYGLFYHNLSRGDADAAHGLAMQTSITRKTEDPDAAGRWLIDASP